MSAACERGAVDTLLVTDSLFRSLEEGTRRAYVDLVEAAREQGATVHVFSSLHVSGEALEQVRSSDGRVPVLLLVCVRGRVCGCVYARSCVVACLRGRVCVSVCVLGGVRARWCACSRVRA